ncbi:MAG TPA: ankyrin repeat domain-containing protein [Noviherbaspirillum sp.]|nr:ankyrin repeat domain-containing protein [Noviherbaspirillum sp.]
MNRASVSPVRRRYIGTLAVAVVSLWVPSASYAGAYDDFFRAVKIDDVKTVKSLLERGLDPNTIEPERGDTGMILALRENAMKVFEALLGAQGINLEARARNGDNALMIACYQGNRPAVEALLSKGAEVNKPGWTPLHYAAAIGNNEIVRLLLDKSAYIDAESPNRTTPLMMAARGGHIMTVKLLHDEGADATLKNELGMTAIDFAEKHNHKDIAEGLAYRLKKAGKF